MSIAERMGQLVEKVEKVDPKVKEREKLDKFLKRLNALIDKNDFIAPEIRAATDANRMDLWDHLNATLTLGEKALANFDKPGFTPKADPNKGMPWGESKLHEAVKTDDDNLSDRIDELADIIKSATDLVDQLNTAETVEKPEDFDSNIDDALDEAQSIVKELKALRAS